VLAGNIEASLRGSIGASVAALGGAQGMPAPSAGGVEVLVDALFNPTFDGVPYMVAGTFGFVLTFLTTLLTAVSVVNERLGGTFEQLQVTPATALEIVLGKLLPLGGVFTFDVVLMVLAAGFLLGVWPHGNPLLFVAVSSFYVLLSLALGLIISATSSTAAEAVQKTVLTSIPLVQLSGFAFPIRNMPMPVQWMTEIFPATHYIRISRAIYLRGEGLTDLLPEIAMLAVFGALLLRKALTSVEARA
jgi:ABC-2 type transport system permease protein